MGKLTLHVPDELVAAAKSEAAAREVSVSKLVTDYFRNLSAKSSRNGSAEGETKLAPGTASLVGCIPDGDIDDYIDHLEEKHS